VSGPVPGGGAHVGEQLSAYLDGELPEAERAVVEAHVRDCVPCSQWLSELQGVDECAQEMEVEAPEGYFDTFPTRVRARLAERRRPRLPVWTWAAAAAVLLAVVTPLTLRRSAAPEPAAVTPARPQGGLEDERVMSRDQAPAAPPRLHVPPATAAPETRSLEKLRAEAPPPPPPPVLESPDRLRERDLPRSFGYAERGQDEQGAKRERAAEARRDAASPAEGFARQAPLQDAPGAAADRAQAAPPPAAAPAAPATPLAQEEVATVGGVVGGTGDVQAEPEKKADAEAALGLRRKGATSTASGSGRDSFRAEPVPGLSSSPASKDFNALAKRSVTSAEEARRLYRDWSALAGRRRGTSEGDEARVRALEALAAAWRLGKAPADRTLARALGEAYVKEPGPQAARVRALLQSLER
jgi:hypothetical protein